MKTVGAVVFAENYATRIDIAETDDGEQLELIIDQTSTPDLTVLMLDATAAGKLRRLIAKWERARKNRQS